MACFGQITSHCYILNIETVGLEVSEIFKRFPHFKSMKAIDLMGNFNPTVIVGGIYVVNIAIYYYKQWASMVSEDL